MRKIIIANNKGGVAKTTTAYNLASFYARNGKRVLVIDCDPQGNLTDALGIDPNTVEFTIYDVLKFKKISDYMIQISNPKTPHFFLVPSNLKSESINIEIVDEPNREAILREVLKEVENDFDICIIDTSPALSLLTFNAIVSADSVYLTLRAGYFELRGAGLLTSTINQVKEELNEKLEIKGIILTQYDIRTSISYDSRQQLEEYFTSKIMKTVIRQNVDLAKAPAFAQDIFEYAPSSNGAKDYEALAHEILEREELA